MHFNEFNFWQNSSKMIGNCLRIFACVSHGFQSAICKLPWTLFFTSLAQILHKALSLSMDLQREALC